MHAWMHQNGPRIDLAAFIFRVKIMIFGDLQKILENPCIFASPGTIQGGSALVAPEALEELAPREINGS